MIMRATVLEVWDSSLLVCDHDSNQRVVVHTDQTKRFCAGDQVCIHFNGIMALSNPPQITANSIIKRRQ